MILRKDLNKGFGKIQEKQRLEKSSGWYNSRKSFDYYLIKYGVKTILKHSKGSTVLEMGCGSGVMTEELVKHFKRVVAVDGSEKYIKETKKLVKSGNISFVCSLFEDFSTIETFSNIIIASILEHVANPVKVLTRAKNWLTKTGRIHIIVPNACSLHRRIGKAMGLIKKLEELQEQDYLIGHRRYYYLSTLTRDLKKAGLKIKAQEGIFLKPLSNAQMIPWPRNLLDAFYEIGKEKELLEYCSQLYLMCKAE